MLQTRAARSAPTSTYAATGAYTLDGRLTNACLMGEAFDKEQYHLRPAAVREVAGLLFVCLSPDEDTPGFDYLSEAIAPS